VRHPLRTLVPAVAGIVTTAALAVLAPMPAQASARRITLGGVRVTLQDGTRQVVTVDHTRGYHAHLDYWVLRQGHWQKAYDVSDGRIGYGGLVAPSKRVQGTGTTPLGTVRLISSFGSHPQRPGWSLPYRRVRAGDYWVEDNGSRYYNRYRNKAQGGFRWWLPASNANSSERLRDFPTQYEYSIVTSYNHDQVRHRGAGIFLHVNGSGATAGCVSGPRSFIRALMWRLDPAEHPLMAVGR
jgi:L,D-peptidoglycan transpeptidase YkuD (ErfK/YbiS/YcfS/YnhG family)